MREDLLKEPWSDLFNDKFLSTWLMSLKFKVLTISATKFYSDGLSFFSFEFVYSFLIKNYWSTKWEFCFISLAFWDCFWVISKFCLFSLIYCILSKVSKWDYFWFEELARYVIANLFGSWFSLFSEVFLYLLDDYWMLVFLFDLRV